MKKLLLAAIVTALMLAGSLFADAAPILPSDNALTVFTDGSFQSTPCATHGQCDNSQLSLVPGDGSPMPVCQPGKDCNNDQFQLRAGDGSPMPVCQPGKNCNNDQFQLRAGDGSPMPVCQPGKDCNNDQFQLRDRKSVV